MNNQRVSHGSGLSLLGRVMAATACTSAIVFGSLVSSVSIAQAVPNDEVLFEDSNLRSCINEKLGQAENAAVTEEQIQTLTFLWCDDRGITRLDGLEQAINLEHLLLHQNTIEDLSPLRDLPRLGDLAVASNQITDLSPLSGLTQLYYLSVSSNPIDSLAPLTTLPSLATLIAENTQLQDLTSVREMPHLQLLAAGANEITDLSPLTELSDLKVLAMVDAQISDLRPLAELPQLRELYLAGNQITDLSPLAGMSDLQTAYLLNQRVAATAAVIGSPISNPLRDVDGEIIPTADYCTDSFCATQIYPEAGVGIETTWDHSVVIGSLTTEFSGTLACDVAEMPVTPVPPVTVEPPAGTDKPSCGTPGAEPCLPSLGEPAANAAVTQGTLPVTGLDPRGTFLWGVALIFAGAAALSVRARVQELKTVRSKPEWSRKNARS